MCVVLYRAKKVIRTSDPELLADSTLPCLSVYWLLSGDQMIMWVPNLDPVFSLDFLGGAAPLGLFSASLDNGYAPLGSICSTMGGGSYM